MRGRSSSSMDDITEAKQEPGVSSAYIRTLVKHLTSKDSLNVTQNAEYEKDKQKQEPQQKKQVRRRLHTSKPYQERLLNMAEARREIVTALKFHRASMKQQQHPSAAFTNPPPYNWPIAPPQPPPYNHHDIINQDFMLPSQTLGLNLNFHNFDNLDHTINVYHSTTSSSSATSSSSSAAANSLNSSTSSGGHHAAMDDEELEQIRSLGEQHQLEWNDTLNLVTSASWSSFLKTMENDQLQIPPWLNNDMQHLDDHLSEPYLQDSALPCMDIGEIEAMDEEWLA